jgi:uncharacterized damage-inducible protein DinB
MLPEFDQEMAKTRTTLERLPDDKFDWKPHAKSFALGALASHIAMIPGWAVGMLKTDSTDIAPVDGPAWQPPKMSNRAEVLAVFDESVKEFRAGLEAVSDAEIMTPWSLLQGGKTIFTMPRIAVLRGIIMNHLIHHRAQLTVYYRLNDIPVPSIYGPSADEAPF